MNTTLVIASLFAIISLSIAVSPAVFFSADGDAQCGRECGGVCSAASSKCPRSSVGWCFLATDAGTALSDEESTARFFA
ncbi:hypothetical protein CLAFUW4_06486 [Fulvia fulva]|uniref:Secreted protein n=1 Tax=Passalora fulva TaxID=5499 RepID=A0A9Q8LIY8_PASFU|nr:uncharacterized protein CLAFUR5_06631 [Fulvia fulva]KAK4621715.1 hypothetical protein CLAFUR4_06490 [Fulvia fulva]KAK4622796.1 hypothetical protein CLAFUR0_06491 [Fulvia fulva]UJO18501.1 hypothetical protein CLAFUR5_06631 [Fulvia fulva]WPV15947.1 hypothetical protein CLAFUW4_06486 [Fulvia fulva]WPV30690.1 hypothetical protein CLAFUW7_06486 [Fulvia fulva]